MNRLPLIIAGLVATTACSVDPGVNPDGARLLVQERVEVDWDRSFDGLDDGIGTLLPVSVHVYDGATGEPLGGVEVALQSGSSGVRPVLVDEVLAVDPDTCGCDAVWDVWADDFYELALSEHPAELEGALTDEDGMLRVYLYVDALPDPRDGGDVTVAVDIGVDDVEFTLVPR